MMSVRTPRSNPRCSAGRIRTLYSVGSTGDDTASARLPNWSRASRTRAAIASGVAAVSSTATLSRRTTNVTSRSGVSRYSRSASSPASARLTSLLDTRLTPSRAADRRSDSPARIRTSSYCRRVATSSASSADDLATRLTAPRSGLRTESASARRVTSASIRLSRSSPPISASRPDSLARRGLTAVRYSSKARPRAASAISRASSTRPRRTSTSTRSPYTPARLAVKLVPSIDVPNLLRSNSSAATLRRPAFDGLIQTPEPNE